MKILAALGVVLLISGCSGGDDRSSIGFSAVQAQASACIHAVDNGNTISFLNTCEYPINAVIFTDSPISLQIEAHTSVDKQMDLPATGLSFAACRKPYLPQAEIESTYSCSQVQ